MTSRPPSLIIAGVNKGGTTTLFSLLAAHPKICPSSVKETLHFLPARYGNPVEDESRYWTNFNWKDTHRYLLEATPGYFYGGRNLISDIKNIAGPETRIIVIFREPVSRALSFFNFQKKMLQLDESMSMLQYMQRSEALSEQQIRSQENNVYFGVEGGRYSNYIVPWIDEFGSRARFIFSENLRSNPRKTLSDLLHWLELDVSDVPRVLAETKNDNVTSAYRWRSMQALALVSNKRFEPFLRRNQWLRNWVRAAYYRVNSRADGFDSGEDVARTRLRKIYMRTNAELLDILGAESVKDLPPWLYPNS